MARFDGFWYFPQSSLIFSAASSVKPPMPGRDLIARFASPQPSITPSQWPRTFPKTKAIREDLSHCSHISALKGGATAVLARLPGDACSDCGLREQPGLRKVALRAATRSQYGREIILSIVPYLLA